MKKLSKLTAILLALTMLLTSLCLTAFADNSDVDISRFSEGTGYLAFGDSITRGYAASEFWDEEGYRLDDTSNPNCRNVTGSYTKLVADAIGCYCPDNILDKDGEYWPIAQDAITTANVLDFIGVEDNYYDSEYAYSYALGRQRYNTLLHYFGDEESMNCNGETRYGKTGEAIGIRELIAQSSLISIAIGMGDIWNRSRTMAQWEYLDGADMSDPTVLINAVKSLVTHMYEGYDYWVKHYPLILDYFKENKRSDAEVVIIGTTNPAFNMNISDEYLIPVGTALSAITVLMNNQYKKWAEEYGFIFVDISNVETGSTENPVGLIDFLTSFSERQQGEATHPTPDGYRQIAREIIFALKERESGQSSTKGVIRVDLGRINSVTDVRIDGDSVKNYTLNDNVLTVTYGLINAKTLTVTSVGDDGKIAVTTYALSYESGEGYSAHRIYTTNDLGAVIKALIKTVIGLLMKIVDLFKK